MSGVKRHPPANRRCQIYLGNGDIGPNLHRCTNIGTHWEKWSGCDCCEKDSDDCEDDFYTWECDGPHVSELNEAA